MNDASENSRPITISVVIPVYNGAMTIEPLVDTLVDGLAPYNLQVVLVNDGSKDNSHQVCEEIFHKYPNVVTYLRLARNFGEHNAVMAGLRHATGDYAVIMDDDFQNPPEEVTRLVQEAARGDFDVVYSFYDEKKHNWFRNLGSTFNGWVAHFMLNKPKGLYLSSFKCLNRFLIREIVKYDAPFPYIDGLILSLTDNIGTVRVRHNERSQGRSGYTFRKLVRLWLSMFVNFSIMPLRLSLIMGFCGESLGRRNGRFSRRGEDTESRNSSRMGLISISDPAVCRSSTLHPRAYGRIYRPHAAEQQPSSAVRGQIEIRTGSHA